MSTTSKTDITGITGKPVKKPPRDAKEHITRGSTDTVILLDNLRKEMASLREALVRTHTVRTRLEDEIRDVKSELINTGNDNLIKLAHTLSIPEVDLFLEATVERALIIDSGRNCENSCEHGYCIGSSCPLYAVLD